MKHVFGIGRPMKQVDLPRLGWRIWDPRESGDAARLAHSI